MFIHNLGINLYMVPPAIFTALTEGIPYMYYVCNDIVYGAMDIRSYSDGAHAMYHLYITRTCVLSLSTWNVRLATIANLN